MCLAHRRTRSAVDNPADVASRGIFPSEHQLWWNGPPWLYDNQTDWLKGHSLDTLEVVCHIVTQIEQPLIPLERYSNYDHLKRVSAYVLFVVEAEVQVDEIEADWLKLAQHASVITEGSLTACHGKAN